MSPTRYLPQISGSTFLPRIPLTSAATSATVTDLPLPPLSECAAAVGACSPRRMAWTLSWTLTMARPCSPASKARGGLFLRYPPLAVEAGQQCRDFVSVYDIEV